MEPRLHDARRIEGEAEQGSDSQPNARVLTLADRASYRRRLRGPLKGWAVCSAADTLGGLT
jgi:hypothetical protein